MQNQHNSLPDDEIDFRLIGLKILNIIQYPFKLLYTHYLISLLFICLSFAMAVAGKLLITKTYQSSFIIRPNDKTEKFHLRILGDVVSVLKQKDWQTLSTLLYMDSVSLKKIISLKLYNSQTKPATDSINYTEVVIETTQPSLFIPFQDCLLNYLENNVYFKKIKGLESERIRIEKTMVEKDLNILDSLKKLQVQNYAQQKGIAESKLLLSDVTNPAAFFQTAIEIQNKKTSLIAQEKFLDNFQLIKSCVPFNRPAWPPRILIMWVYLIPVFLFFCFVFLHFKRKNKNL